jgi:YbbR domain-containing protein
MKKTIGPFLNQKIALPIGAFSLAILLWVFVVSGNEYTMIIDLPIEARNLNVQKAHKEEVPNFAAVRLKGTGRDLFKSYVLKNFSGIKLVLDLEGISQEYEFILKDYFEKNPEKVVLPLNYNISFIEVIYPNRIKISLDDYKVKSVPVLSNMIVNPAPGHVQVGVIEIIPNIIEIAGPKEELALINHVETLFDTVYGALNPSKTFLNIESPGRLIEYSESRVEIRFDIQQISERIIVDIPVKVINIPKKIRVFPSPQTVSLTVIGGVNRIAELKPEEIEVIINFNEWDYQKQFYEPEVIVPANVLELRDLSPRNLEIAVAREVK